MEIFTSISLIAAFVAGMVALFAPCCITYLLPAYFGNIFRERKQVLLMTLIYSLGIFVVMLPVVLGARVISQLFFRLHDQTYYIGGAFMIILSIFSLLGIKLPMINLKRKNSGKVDAWSTFTLGIFSGITSSCCAPVLVGVITLSSLSPTLVTSLGVGIFYVLGMVAPMYLASVLIDRRNILERPIMRRRLKTVKLFGREYLIIVSNLIAATVFFITGVATIGLTRAGLLGMNPTGSGTTKLLYQIAGNVTEFSQRLPGLNFIFVVLSAWFIVKIIKWSRDK